MLMSTYFLFNGKFCEHKHGIAMGSVLALFVINSFMNSFEKQALSMACKRPSCWYKCLDGAFVRWPHGIEELREFQRLSAYI
jgi:hypothetical protein